MQLAQLLDIQERYARADVNRTIAPDDLMFQGPPESYFAVGKSGLDAILQALHLSWCDRVNAILDLPCGHGRVARHLRAAFPNATLTVCDVEVSAVDFCARTFNGVPVISVPDLTQVRLPGPFDVIWVGSLFTHIDADRCRRWLAFLAAQLSEHGVLVASVHGRWALKQHEYSPFVDNKRWADAVRQYEASGYGYVRYPTAVHGLDTNDYGVSITRASRIVDMVDAIDGVRLVGYLERGWAGNHDVVMISKNDRFRPY